MADAVSVVAVLISFIALAKQLKSDRDSSIQVFAEKLENELKLFADNILGWYNQITEFIISITSELRSPHWDHSINSRYRLLLDKLRNSDTFYSNCRNSVKHLSRYEEDQSADSELVKRLRQLIAEYELFEQDVFHMKDEIGRLLGDEVVMSFSDSNQSKESLRERKALADRIEQDFSRFQTYKNALLRIIGN